MHHLVQPFRNNSSMHQDKHQQKMAFICLSEAGSAQQTKFVSIVIFNTEGMYKILLNSV
jgi:hypothetical protein